MSDFDRIEEAREHAEGLAHEEWVERMRGDDDEQETDDDGEENENDADND